MVAALTVPTLIVKYQKEQTVTKLKKAYSTLAQASNMIIAENGSPKSGWLTDIESAYSMYKKYLNNAKDCNSATGCINQETYKWLDGIHKTKNFDTSADRHKLVTTDGMQIIFDRVSSTCNANNHGSIKYCVYILADVNGAKKPNQVGRDLFGFVLKENGLFPSGCDNPDEVYCSTTLGENGGYGCACKVLREGAINY